MDSTAPTVHISTVRVIPYKLHQEQQPHSAYATNCDGWILFGARVVHGIGINIAHYPV